jgi:hypothetical protein
LLLASDIHIVSITLPSRCSSIISIIKRKTESGWSPHERSLGTLFCGGEEKKTERSFLYMLAMTFVAPLLPGKEEWRRFMQDVVQERLPEYEELRQRLGICNGSMCWLARRWVKQ